MKTFLLPTHDLSSVDATISQSERPGHPVKILILYGSLREGSYSKKLALESAEILRSFGAQVRIFDPQGLPIYQSDLDENEKVQELRQLALWSEGMLWCSPELHGNMSGLFKNQIDWIPLSIEAVRPTQGRTLAVMQVNGGSQSFNAVNNMRILGRWMRMFTIPNQSSIPKVHSQFEEGGRLKESAYKDRVVDVLEELYRMTILLRPHVELLTDRYSENKARYEVDTATLSCCA
ncbi:MAG: arsenical resistance protein ArsH [Oceanospirillaceae bacterium]|nr:arsenical resistance protein ArsH [Oceanospirillaceae bacterium]